MFRKSHIALIAALATVLAAPAYAAHPGKHAPHISATYTAPQFAAAQSHDWQLEGRLPLPGPYSAN